MSIASPVRTVGTNPANDLRAGGIRPAAVQVHGAHRWYGAHRVLDAQCDAFGADDTIHQYHRAAQELWKFCWSGGAGANIELVDGIIERQSISGENVDWWQRGQPRRPR